MSTGTAAARGREAIARASTSAASATMQAVIREDYGPPEALRVAEIDRPYPAAGEVLVRIRAAGVERGAWHLVTGLPYLVRLAGYGVRRPGRPCRARSWPATSRRSATA